ncbi:hypothetical protein T12_10782 [Trichinella patagoniensis]|uniref:Uncharacterized protein n=1 Tax=Trichinella patagoniensis TaxID=990121 RepID=A0A0V0YTI0_9BILA|nr:hypothetical protein T12_10782 [Trichinella patagoniensis]
MRICRDIAINVEETTTYIPQAMFVILITFVPEYHFCNTESSKLEKF